MDKVSELLKQRRIWAGIVAVATVLSGWFGLDFIADPETVIGLLSNFGIALSQVIESAGVLITGTLAVWSYFQPKK